MLPRTHAQSKGITSYDAFNKAFVRHPSPIPRGNDCGGWARPWGYGGCIRIGIIENLEGVVALSPNIAELMTSV